jgi:glutathione S-transferase
MAKAKLLISSKNYSSWSLRGFLLVRLSGLPFDEEQVDPHDAGTRAELLLQSSSIRIPCLIHDGLRVWDTMAIAEYLHEIKREARMFPEDLAARARCRSISGEMHSGFYALRSSLPMNLRVRRQGFPIWSGPKADVERIVAIWRDCFMAWGGPFLFGERPTVADAMYAPVVTRFLTYDVALDRDCADYGERIMAWPAMADWVEAAKREPEEPIHELEVEAEF